jgi:tellurite resistance protein TerC
MQTLGFPLDTTLLFVGVFVASLITDLVQHRSNKEVTVRNAAAWSIFWIALSLAFYGWVYVRHGAENANLFLSGYVLEKTLSVDNLMVFIAVFKFFQIRSGLQHRILYYGILGAIVFRAVFVGVGAAAPAALETLLRERFGKEIPVQLIVELLFGTFIVVAAWKMLRGGEDETEEEAGAAQQHTWPVRLLRWMFKGVAPYFPHLVGDNFFVTRDEAEPVARQHGVTLAAGAQRFMTPAFVCLLVIEGSDVMFSFDSVPAVIAVTREPLLVYTAMIFAVLGLRSLYFILAALTKYLAHLEKAVIAVLFFIAFKMFYAAIPHIVHWQVPFEITPNLSLVIVLGTLGAGVLASFVWPEAEAEAE